MRIASAETNRSSESMSIVSVRWITSPPAPLLAVVSFASADAPTSSMAPNRMMWRMAIDPRRSSYACRRPTERAPGLLLAPFCIGYAASLGGFVESAFRLRDDGAESLALMHRDVGEHLAVEVDPRELQRVDELAIG